MVQHVVADAASFRDGLKANGHVAVEGIYFDTAKSVVKPESTPALQEVAKLLAADPSLKLWVVGHTDSVGAVDANMKLAQARAEAVVAALVSTHGVAAARLKGYGVGPLAPGRLERLGGRPREEPARRARQAVTGCCARRANVYCWKQYTFARLARFRVAPLRISDPVRAAPPRRTTP